ncbi:MAG: Dyp-type peroxidase [Polyangiaceae bacterium]
MSVFQSAILAPVPSHARVLTFGLAPSGADDASAPRALARVAELSVDPRTILGIGHPLVAAAPRAIEGLHAFPALTGKGLVFPSTQGALWAYVQGRDPGEILHRARKLQASLGPGYLLEEDIATFAYAEGRDLSGYEDGTENPKDERATEVAIVAGRGAGLDGASFVSVQRWIHDLARFDAMTPEARDHAIGRRIEDNEEMASAPASAHVKRSAQESFDPPAFMLRRSMPYGTVAEHGLYFIAFGATVDPFERVLRRMAGLDDGIVDGLMRFSRAVTGGHYFCPPLHEGRLDLRALGL